MKRNPNDSKPETDIHDNRKDREKMQPEEVILDLPEVKDIPGQEHVRPMPFGELADTTISSADEEADHLFEDEEDADLKNEPDTNVTREEKELLRRSSESMASEDDESVRRATLDRTDEDGTPLYEKVNTSGTDLDVPGSEIDDDNEEIGEEDEENNSYSIPDQGPK
jgi:hypothetical protein